MTILTFVWLLGGEAMIAPAEAGQAGLGRGRPRAQDCQEDTAAPGLASEAREREQLSVQPRQSASAEWPAVRQSVTISVTVSRALSRSHHTQLSLCHA